MPALKDRKRILNKDGTPAKVVQKLDKSPVFRQNGYNLKFDAANSDYMECETSLNWGTTNDLDFKVSFKYEVGSQLRPFSVWDGQNYIYLQVSGTSLLLRQSSNSLGLVTSLVGDCINGLNYFSISGGVATFNGTVSNPSQVNDISISNGKSYLSRLFVTNFYSGIIYSLEIEGEKFNLSDYAYGTTITGSNGTAANINTSAAQSTNYINTEMWQKNSFALGFNDSTEVLVDENIYDFTWLNASDIDFKVHFENKNPTSQSVILSKGHFNNSNTGYLYLRQDSPTSLKLSFSAPNNVNPVSYFMTISENSNNTVEVKGLRVYLNDVEVYSFSDFVCNINKNYNNQNANYFRLGSYAWGAGSYANMNILGLSFNGIDQDFTRGLGNKTKTKEDKFVYVDIYGADSTRKIFVNDGKYKHEFRYVEDTSKRQKLWRYYGCNLVSDNSIIITNGDSEGVVKEFGKTDFSGGFHGDEEFTLCDFYLDGVLLDITNNKTGLKGNIFTRKYNTDIYDVDNSVKTTTIQRISTFNVKYKEIEYDLGFLFVSNMTLTQSYLGMSSIYNSYNELDVNGSTYQSIEGSNDDYFATSSTLRNTTTSNEIDSQILYKFLPANWTNNELKWYQTAGYNKIYYGCFDTINVLNGEEMKCFYRLKFS